MKFISPFLLLPFLFTLSVWSATPVPYSGKIDIRGVNYFGEAQFAFSLHDGNGTTHWRNGNQAGETIKVTIRNGRYTVLLGGQGMNSLPPELFLNHDKLYLKVEFDNEDGEGLRHLAPDQLITSTPRALVAEVAKVAQVAEKVGNGAITRDMLSSEVLAKLDANATASPSTPVTITREMLPQDVRDDLNKTITITRNMLPADVLSDLNRTISKSMLGSDVLADLNKSSTTLSPITLSMLDPEVTAKLDQNATIGASSITKSMLAQEVLNDLNGSTTVVNPPAVGSIITVPYGQAGLAGYSLYQQGTPKELVWEEKAPVSLARMACDGVEFMDGKVYFIGGVNGSGDKNIAERYDPATNNWETINSMSAARSGVAASALDTKLYAIGGTGLSSVEVFDPNTGNWTLGVALPSEVNNGTAITVNEKIYLVGGRNSSSQNINQVLSFDPFANQWTTKASMPTARHGHKLVWFENRIWAIGGSDGSSTNKVESYDPISNSWRVDTSLTVDRHWPVAWATIKNIFVGGGGNGSYLNSIEFYDPMAKRWLTKGVLPLTNATGDATALNGKVYAVIGQTASGVFSNKVYAADLNASVDGVYDLYRKDGNASAGTPVVQAEVADGSVTTAKLNATILKYLKPEITTQPQAQIVYADSNASFSVTAEGKYLTYQWKKDGGNLTGETNATINIVDANATQDDGNYSVVVSNDFGSVETGVVEVLISDALLNGLVGWWKFDETNGTVAYDSSGNGNDGNLTNGPTWTSGKIGGALSFDGVDDWVKLGADPFSDVGLPNQAATFSIWFKIQTTTTTQSIFSDYTGITGGDNHFVASLGVGTSTKFGAATRYAGTNYEFGSNQSNLMNNTWHAATYVMDPSINLLKLYINGSLDSQNQYIGSQNLRNGSEWKFGAQQYSGSMTSLLKGLLDDARVYDRALSAAEVQALYNMGQ